jgi:hypothetical protein
MGVFFAKLLELLSTGNKYTMFRLIALSCFLLVVFPLILDYFYGNIKLDQEIKLIKELNSIDKDDIKDDRLKEYYEKTINSVVNRKPFRIPITVNVLDNDTNETTNIFTFDNIIKFISGAFWWLLLLIVGMFTKQKNISSKIGLIIFLVFLVMLFGIIGVIIPSFTPKFVNYIGFPLLQFILGLLIAILIIKLNKAKPK